MNRLRVLIIDDERPARALIRKFLQDEPDIEIAGEAASGRQAVELIHSTLPDLIFLDIQMPGLNGFQVLKSITSSMPYVIFVTAFDRYALRAFEVHALDYLLKPFNLKRFSAALSHARGRIRTSETSDLTNRIEKLMDHLEKSSRYIKRLAVDQNGRIVLIATEEIDWIEAAQKYVQVQTRNSCYLLRESITALEQNLDPRKFIRVHRSTIINVSRIQEIQPWFHGRHVIVLSNGKRFTSGRKYRERLLQLLHNFPD